MSCLREAALDASGHRIAFCEAGPPDAPGALVCVHGAGGSREGWVRLMRDLAGRGVASLALELPGHGKSSPARIADIGEYAGIVLRFLEARKLEAACLAGHSMGGAVALRCALSRPGLPGGLVLIGTGGRLRVKQSILEGAESRFEETVEEIIACAFSPTAAEALLREGARGLRSCRPETLRGDFLACDAFDVLSELESIAAPALVVCGEDDLLTPPKYARFLADGMPDARLALIPRAGHMAMLERPETVGSEIARFLDDLRASPDSGG